MKQNTNNSQLNITHRKSANVFKTWLFLIIFALILSAIGFVLASVFNSPMLLYTGFAAAIAMNIWSYWYSDKAVLKMAGAVNVEENDSNRDLFNLVRELSMKANLPMPKVYIINDPSPNAFATGRNPENSAVAFTTGILALLNRSELAGVAAHELSHIKNRDTLLMTVVAVMASVISFVANYAFFFNSGENENKSILMTIFAFLVVLILAPLAATLIQMAISRKREFLADSTGADIAGSPEGLADALKKIHNFPVGMNIVNPSISHLYISNPEKDSDHHHTPWYSKLFMTHPPLSERLANLLDM
jgi:heat shock protein HtpX